MPSGETPLPDYPTPPLSRRICLPIREIVSTYPARRAGAPGAGGFRRRLPWVFVLGVAAGTMLPLRHGCTGRADVGRSQAARDAEMIWRRAGNPTRGIRSTCSAPIDGDTFEARVHLWPGLDLTTRVRLRGIDAPELKAPVRRNCSWPKPRPRALRACSAKARSRSTISAPTNITAASSPTSPTRRTPNVSAALLAAGHARSYGGGHRNGWCAGQILSKQKSRAARLFDTSNAMDQRVTTTVVPTETR